MKKRITITAVITTIIIISIFFQSIINFIVNIKWFSEVGYLSVYFTKVTSMIKLVIPLFVAFFVFVWIYYRSIKKSIIRLKSVEVVDVNKIKLEKKIFFISDAIFSLFISISLANTYWYKILQFINSTKYNISDPIFNKDISFFIFKLPLIESIYNSLLGVLIFIVIVTLVVYFILSMKDSIIAQKTKTFSSFKEFKSGLTKFAGRQLAIVSALILLLISLGFFIKAWNLVYSPRGVVFGASYTDVKVSLNFYRIIAVSSAIASIVIFVSILLSKVKPIVFSVIGIVVLVLCENIVSGVVQHFIVQPNGIKMEEPYIAKNIEYTRKGFNIDSVSEIPFKIKNNLTKKDIEDNKMTIENIKINSYKPALEFYNQFQYIKYYYDFNDIDVDRYTINGKYSQVFIAPREIDLKSLKGKGNDWQNTHLIYTHGYGVVMNKINSVTESGQPDFVIKDIPTVNLTDIPLKNPRIYFGEKTNDYAIVNTNIGEVDYPKGDGNNLTNYAGKAGISMSFGNRILFAIDKKSTKFLLSNDITSKSKVLINRNIMKRVNKIAPFLIYDNDPYLVINDGKLYWIIDAYTVSNRYPFSQPVNGINYIRNSIKVVVDAYDGNVDYYIVDNNDPVAQTYSKIFPKLFKESSDIPNGIKKHFKYPEEIFKIQCKVLGRYHVTDPGIFYREEAVWNVAKNQETVEGKEQENKASYMIMKLPKENKEEMILVEYFNTKGKNNMVALFGARMDGKNYGKMVLYRFKAGETIYSPILFKNKINQDTVISKELSLLNMQGSQVIHGDTSIIPIKNSLLYVEPLYIRASGKNSIPEVKKIIVSYNDKIVLANGIDEALNKIFNYDIDFDTEKRKNIETEVGKYKYDINRAKELYEKAIEAQKKGDWSRYGKYIDELGKLLEQLSK
ncbi:hypothetical protein CLTEP_21300 [Clostridium tepidiprofundi DSM 19306]|uniref:UPF0182 protein CLTEP_21300 n=1 Tax=Clostridium tepidiprofundi DSM 19306 TaxID=1121338 RepID=A0A151B210_9CLOT|nr:UPF0182 family protein [Clostridium tepidiprofundi]KYH33951.1 hypothetical protein CLTEP_21300 [Clostridium tepidiprofundi DSM 19306]